MIHQNGEAFISRIAGYGWSLLDFALVLPGGRNFPSLGPQCAGKPERSGPQAEFSFSNSLTCLSAAVRLLIKFI
jgi:hypothetical protein